MRAFASCLAAAVLVAGPAAARDNADETAVRSAVTSLLDSWRTPDRAKADAVLHPEFRLTTRREIYDGEDPALKDVAPYVGISTRQDIMKLYDRPGVWSWDDRLSDVHVWVDPAGVASLTARYRFLIEGRLTHCGAVAFQLYKTARGWQIVSFADTHHWAKTGEIAGCSPPAA